MDDRAKKLEEPSNRRRRDLLSPVYLDTATDQFYNFPVSLYDEEE